ncbi:MAG: MerR family transcriptional regulator [Ignavibacteria bacterium]
MKIDMKQSNPKYKISEAAKILGISVHTLRMYEREGLIIPYKKSTKQRVYSDEDIDRLKCIRNAINEEN